MDQFADRLARLADLSPEELDALESELVAAFDQADSAGEVDLMQQLADALDTVRAAKTATPPAGAPPAGAPAAQAAPVAAAADVIEVEPVTEEPPVDTLPEVSSEAETPPAASDEPAAPGEPEVPADPSKPSEPQPGEPQPPDEDALLKALVNVNRAELEALAALPEADRKALSLMVAAQGQTPNTPTEEEQVAPDQQEEAVATEVVTQEDVPDANKPVPVAAAAPFTITAGGDIPGVTSGQRLSDMDEVIDALTRKINAMRGVSGDGEYVVVASIRRDDDAVDETKMLRRADPEGNSAKIREFLKANGSRESLVAAGWCAPRTPLYDIPGIGSTDTPVADSLPSFGVDRGGIIWTEPPSLGGVISSLGANSFVRWIPGNSAGTISQVGVVGTTPTSPVDTKPCIDITCGVERSADLIALPLCLCFDLLSSRTNPEFVRASTDLVQVAQAHFKEQWLLASLFSAPGVVNNPAGATPPIYGTPDIALGAARDFLVQIRLVGSQFKWRNRLSPTQQMRLYAPNWLRDAMAADLMLQAPGDNTLSTGYAEIDGYLNDANVDTVWYIDDVPVMAAGTPPAGPQGATTAASNFDAYSGFAQTAEWLITTPGVFTRLDGGSVDLGVVRTKDDVQKNKFCEFSETFESVAYMGPQTAANAWAVRGSTPIKIIGGYARDIDTAAGVAVE